MKSVLSCLLLLQFVVVQSLFAEDTTGGIAGQVLDQETREPLTQATITILNTQIGTISDANGDFAVQGIAAGTYSVQVSLVGYEVKRIENVTVTAGDTVVLKVELGARPIPLSEVTVTPGRFEIMGSVPESRQVLTRQDIETVSFAEDVYRAAARLPGIAASDFSSKLVVRGGEHDEVLVLFDGLELCDPFHLKDFGGMLSIIDVEAIEGIDLLTGGFPAEFGNRQSGVLNMKLKRAPADHKRFGLGISFMNMRAMSEGSFNDGRGSWFFSGRRGYLDVVLSLVGEGEDVSPKYYDVLGKVEYRLNPNHSLAVNFLQAGDRLDLVLEDEEVAAHSRYDNTYGWARLKSTPAPHLFAQTVLAAGRVAHERQGKEFGRYWYASDSQWHLLPLYDIGDERKFDFYALRQDWEWEASDRWYLKWGLDAKRLVAEYDYANVEYAYEPLSYGTYGVTVDSTAAYKEPKGSYIGAYLASRFRPFAALTAEAGLRYDGASYTHDRLVSPRLSLAYALGDRSALRVGWGHYYQNESINEISVQDGETDFYPAELAEHRTIGLEHRFEDGLHLRLEAYQKRLSDLRPEYSNTSDDFVAFPEVEDDRALVLIDESTAEGAEIYLRKDTGGKWTWWASYALALSEDKVRSITLAGEEYALNGDATYPRKFDQRHTVYLDVNYRPNKKWHLSAAWQYHSGRPYTSKHLELIPYPEQPGWSYYKEVYGAYNGERYPAYHRLDLRINRYFETSKGRLAVFAEVINLYDRSNVRTYDYNWKCRQIGENSWDCHLEQDPEYWIPRLPSVGISWQWDM